MNKKSVGVKSGDRGGRGIGPPRPIRLLGSHMVARFIPSNRPGTVSSQKLLQISTIPQFLIYPGLI